MTACATLLGPRMAELSPAIRALHAGPGRFAGRIAVIRPANPLLNLAAALAGFPPAAPDAPLALETRVEGGRDRWIRRIGDHVMSSSQWAEGGMLAERLGPATALTTLSVRGGALEMRGAGMRALGLPVPRALSPRVETREWQEGGRYHFRVAVDAPFGLGPLIRYEGWLAAAPDAPPDASAGAQL